MQNILYVLTLITSTYVIAFAASQIAISLFTWRIVRSGVQYRRAELGEYPLTGQEPPISVIIPAYNEEMTIVNSVRSMLQLRYVAFEVIVVNDGSRDGTMENLIREFKMTPVPAATPKLLATANVRNVYLSPDQPNLRVVDKENGGKADAINAGINQSVTPLFCCLDADSILHRDALLRAVQPFIHDPVTVACGGTVRLANGCQVRDGHLLKAGLPSSMLARFQIVEYLRAYQFGRMGWSVLNGLLIISGAFGLMRRETVVQCGGYRRQTIGEDMELIVRMHGQLQKAGRPYKISYVSEPVCWTEAPEDLRTLRNQRVRWYRGLCESLWLNRDMLWRGKPNIAGWLAFPYFVLFEWASPMVELMGYFLLLYLLATGGVDPLTSLLILGIALGLGVLLSTLSLMLEEASFHMYPRMQSILLLFWVAVLENFGYRQLNIAWRLQGLWQWMRGKRGGWGTMQRKGMGGPG